MKVHAAGFHPMKGHVEHEAIVLFSSGRELTIYGHGTGWVLVDDNGIQVGPKAYSAMELTKIIVDMEAA